MGAATGRHGDKRFSIKVVPPGTTERGLGVVPGAGRASRLADSALWASSRGAALAIPLLSLRGLPATAASSHSDSLRSGKPLPARRYVSLPTPAPTWSARRGSQKTRAPASLAALPDARLGSRRTQAGNAFSGEALGLGKSPVRAKRLLLRTPGAPQLEAAASDRWLGLLAPTWSPPRLSPSLRDQLLQASGPWRTSRSLWRDGLGSCLLPCTCHTLSPPLLGPARCISGVPILNCDTARER